MADKTKKLDLGESAAPGLLPGGGLDVVNEGDADQEPVVLTDEEADEVEELIDADDESVLDTDIDDEDDED